MKSTTNQGRTADRIEAFVRGHFQIAAHDRRFSPHEPLFESGYVDSVGVIELLAFLTEEFGVVVPDDALTSDEFSTIHGIAAIVERLRNGARSAVDGGSPGGHAD